jgi:hypothetical protein
MFKVDMFQFEIVVVLDLLVDFFHYLAEFMLKGLVLRLCLAFGCF